MKDFSQRLKQVIKEFGSRYALAKVSGIPASSLQSYEAGSKPGMDALATLARVANVDLNWLLTGRGEMRPPGLLSGAVFADILMVDQYELGTALSMSVVVGQIPFSRNELEGRLRLKEPTRQTLLCVEAGSNLNAIRRGDLVLIDRNQDNLARDGIYLVDFPGIELRGILWRPGGRVRIAEPEYGKIPSSGPDGHEAREELSGVFEMNLGDLLGTGSKIIGRAVAIRRSIA